MTAQEVFDTVVAHLRSQGRKAEDGEGCLYRGPDGTACAAGCLIKDEEYNSNMERQNVRALLGKNSTPESLKERLLPHLNLLSDLQNVHDHYDTAEWEYHFAKVAETKGILYTPKTV